MKISKCLCEAEERSRGNLLADSEIKKMSGVLTIGRLRQSPRLLRKDKKK